MSTPFTHEQAEEICEDFEDLIDTELIIGTIPCFIDNVIIVPFQQTDRDIFMHAFKESNDAKKALETYTGNDYDVILLASNVSNPHDVIVQYIREYIENNGVAYNFPD